MLIVYLFFLGFISMILRAIGLIQCLEIQCLSSQYNFKLAHLIPLNQVNTILVCFLMHS